jgi:hypothetical protein
VPVTAVAGLSIVTNFVDPLVPRRLWNAANWWLRHFNGGGGALFYGTS